MHPSRGYGKMSGFLPVQRRQSAGIIIFLILLPHAESGDFNDK